MSDLKYNPIIDEEDDFYDDEDEVVIESPKNTEPAVTEKKGVIGKMVFEDDEDEPQSSTENDILTQEEKMRYYSDKVMSAIVGGKEVSKYAVGKLLSSTTPELFRDENYVLFSMIYNYKSRLRYINIDSDFVYLFLDNNRNLIDKSTAYIDIHAYGEVDGSETLGYISGVVKHFNRLCSMPDMSEADFDLVFEKYLVVFKSIEAQKAYAQGMQILSEGLKIKGKLYSGFDDSQNFVRRKLAEIEGLVDMNKGTGFTSMRELLLTKKSEAKKPFKISDFGKLDALNKIYGGVYTSNFYQVMAPTKGGKSKFCARMCHTTIVEYGNNVTVWAQEGGNEAWSAQMRAIHFDYTYNEGVSVKDKKFGIDQDVILFDKYPNQDLRDLEMASTVDLASNMEYGNVDYIDRPFEVETFLDEIDTSVKANNSKLIIIDYLQLIGSKNNRVSKSERIGDAYKKLLEYCKKNNVAVITPAQYKQDSIDSMSSKTDTSDADMRTAGGESSEVYRTPDIIFALWASTTDLRNNRMKILSVPCRFNKPFPEVPCYIDLGVCQFVSLED